MYMHVCDFLLQDGMSSLAPRSLVIDDSLLLTGQSMYQLFFARVFSNHIDCPGVSKDELVSIFSLEISAPFTNRDWAATGLIACQVMFNVIFNKTIATVVYLTYCELFCFWVSVDLSSFS